MVTEGVKICRCALGQIKDQTFDVIIPYAVAGVGLEFVLSSIDRKRDTERLYVILRLLQLQIMKIAILSK